MPRFFIKKEDFDGATVKVRGEDAFHIARALRLAVGDGITVCTEDGETYSARLSRIRDDEAEAEITGRLSSSESPLGVTLFMGYPKGDKLETVVQKAVELGVCRVTPFLSSRCVKRPDEKGDKKARERLSRIADEASKQCGRSRLSEITPTVPFSEVLKSVSDFDLPLFCYEGDGTLPLPAVLTAHPDAQNVCVIVGSEGGFSPEEAEAAADAGFIPVNLGPRILRCETAPSFVLSALCYEYELKK